MQHTDLDGAEAAATGEHEGRFRLRPVRHHVTRQLREA
jgi:hypothetical protein